ncbi:MAG: FAD-dependent oxidoreductase [Planctomycetota bacterium]
MKGRVPRILLVGVGRFGRAHLAEWRRVEREGLVELVGAVVATEASARRLRAEEPGSTVHVGLTDELLRDVDGVDVATPAETHAEIVARCLEHAHVLVEKPVATSPEEGRALGELAERLGRVLMVGHVYRWHPVVQRLKELTDALPERPRAVHGVLVNPPEAGVEELDPNLEMLHLFDVVDLLFGELPEVSVGRRRNGANVVSLRYPGPMNVVLRIGWEGRTKIRKLELTYPKRRIKCDFVDNTIEVATRADQVEKQFFPHDHGALAAQFRAFAEAVAGRRRDVPDAALGARIVDVAVGARPSPVPERPRVAVIGGGMFGAACALEMARTADVVVHERHPELLTEVSFLNQWRHHSGFHYPRSYDTIQEIKACKSTFEAEYGEAIVRAYPSYYCTSNTGVEIPAERYLAAVQGNNLNFQIQAPPADVLDHSKVSIAVRSDEAVYDYHRLRSIVAARLEADPNVRVELGTEVVDGTIARDGSKHLEVRGPDGARRTEAFDYVINATYANLNLVAKWFGLPVEPLRFDIYELLVLRIPVPQICVTIIDGPFTSLVGMGSDDLFMLSHIHDSVLRSVITEDGLPPNWGEIRSNRENMLRHSRRYLPVLDRAEVVESRYATRAVNAYARDFDARPTVVRSHGFGIWSVLGGKILTCVSNAREIANEIAAERGIEATRR